MASTPIPGRITSIAGSGFESACANSPSKRGHIAPELRPVSERLDLDVGAWVENVEAYAGPFYRLAGKINRVGEVARATGHAWLHGQRGARRLYAKTG